VFNTDVAKVDQDVAFVIMVCIRMLQTSILNVSSIFHMYIASVFIWMLYMFHTYVVSVLFGCCICFDMVSSVFCKCFICLLLYVASVASGYFKSRSGVAHVAMAIRACFKCFIFFRRMLQAFHLDFSKVDLREAHTAASVPP
jgi:hypothetical protein